MEKVQVGVIGCGSIGAYHITSYQKTNKAEVVALCDVEETTLKAAQAKYNISKGYLDYKDLLSDSNVEAVSVCLPNRLHSMVTVDALKAGKHVLCEKPPAINASETQRMFDTRDKTGKKLLIGLTMRFRNDSCALKSHIDAGELGEVYYAKCGYLRRSGIPGMGSWFTRKSDAGAGPIYDIGVHALDLTMWLMNNFEARSAFASSYAKFGPFWKGAGDWGKPVPGGSFDVEDLATAMIRMRDGATIFLEVSWASFVGEEQFYSILLGDKGGADLANVSIISEEHEHFVEKKVSYSKNDPYVSEVEHFVDCILSDKEPITTAEQMIALQKILDAVLESAEKKKEVHIT
jgi:predicted dehydrogenase